MIELCKAADPNMSSDKIIRKLIGNLLPNFLQTVNLMDPKTVPDFLAAMKKVEETHYLIKSHKDSELLLMADLATQRNSSSENSEVSQMLSKMNDMMTHNTQLMQMLVSNQARQSSRTMSSLACQICGLEYHGAQTCRFRNQNFQNFRPPQRDFGQRNYSPRNYQQNGYNRSNNYNYRGNQPNYRPRYYQQPNQYQGNDFRRTPTGPRNPGRDYGPQADPPNQAMPNQRQNSNNPSNL